ncbi:SRPBCC family protein [Niveibacterium sp. SC-1]|uniref:SRPBCC family protein n=1 Tax=Niveibacterium sp. SC-1 TaxID=3135646 RepID=UPI00311D519A
MQFEHVVVVNDPKDPLNVPLDREQVWAGLMRRVEDPLPFQIGLEACEILEREPGRVERLLDFGGFRMRDTVRYRQSEWLSFETAATEDRAGGLLTISIEEPDLGYLVLRFRYDTTLDDRAGGEGAELAGFVRSAYHQADIDTVRRIREYAAQKLH